ncbi:MAG: ZIP family metal transporter [Corallococcus sp.]|nr:ZIP family metal transporter [Corallococcus sp.]
MNTVAMTIVGMTVIFVATTLGSAVVYLFKNTVSHKINSLFLGFSSGIMIAASVWSLLIPAIEGSTEQYGQFSFVPAAIGLVLGALFLVLIDRLLPVLNKSDGMSESLKPMKLFFAVTVHNIPEGLAVGFAFGAAARQSSASEYAVALGLAVGIAIQNIPEGAAVSLPMKSATGSKHKAFLFGMASGAVEPVFAVIGYYLASLLSFLQPWFLSFAAGAMLFVVAEDLIPDAQTDDKSYLSAWGVIAGFAIMMILDVALG